MAKSPPAMPRSFTVVGVRWRLTCSAAGWGEAVALTRHDGASGLTLDSMLLVAIEPGLPLAAERAVLWHELVHVALAAAGWRETHAKATELEESVAYALSYVGLAILRDNKALRRYLFGP